MRLRALPAAAATRLQEIHVNMSGLQLHQPLRTCTINMPFRHPLLRLKATSGWPFFFARNQQTVWDGIAAGHRRINDGHAMRPGHQVRGKPPVPPHSHGALRHVLAIHRNSGIAVAMRMFTTAQPPKNT
jgi:hypothetical protein